MTTEPPLLAALQDGPWTLAHQERTQSSTRLLLNGPHDSSVPVHRERCLVGRLRNAYPVGSHDLELRVEGENPQELAALLRALFIEAAQAAEPMCRRIVFAAAPDDISSQLQAQAAGMHPAAEVDLGEEELDLLVAEPHWVTQPTPTWTAYPAADG